MCQNCSISFSVDPGGANNKFENLAHPRYNYDMQSSFVMTYIDLGLREGLARACLWESLTLRRPGPKQDVFR